MKLLTFVSWFEEASPPLHISLPPPAIPMADRRSGFDEEIATDVVPVRNYHMVFSGVLPEINMVPKFYSRSTHHFLGDTGNGVSVVATRNEEFGAYAKNHAPVSISEPFCFQARKWFPPKHRITKDFTKRGGRRTCYTFPACSPLREVVLPC